MAPWQPEVLAAVTEPDVITPDRTNKGRWNYWIASTGPSRWLFVVVDWTMPVPEIRTAFSKRKDPL